MDGGLLLFVLDVVVVAHLRSLAGEYSTNFCADWPSSLVAQAACSGWWTWWLAGVESGS